jgi:hypothetical protein
MILADTLTNAKNVATFVAVLLGIVSGTYALWQSYRKSQATQHIEKATAEAQAEAKRLEDRSTAIAGLEQSVKSQGIVISGLTLGFQECIERDNKKQVEIDSLQARVADLTRQVIDLKAARP